MTGTAATTELFHNDVPVLRASLIRHGLVDLSFSPPAGKFPVEPHSSEDLKAADEEEWVRTVTPEGDGALTGGGAKVESEDAGLRTFLGVNSVVVGHVRAAEELRRTLLSPHSPRDPLRPRSTVHGNADDARARIKRSSSLKDGPTPPGHAAGGGRGPAAVASAAASAAVAAARGGARGDRRGYAGVAAGAPAGGAVSSAESAHAVTHPGVSMAAVLDIAVNLFGSGGGGSGGGGGGSRRGITSTKGRRGDAGSVAKGSSAISTKDEGLATFTVDVHTGGGMTLGIGVKELGGGAVVVEDLHRPPGQPPGAAERAGIALGDVILGINYEPLEKGLVHTSAILAEAITVAGFVKLQISRAVSPSNGKRRLSLPGKDCPIITELMWRTAQLRKAGVLTSSERHTIAGFILKRMAWEEGTAMGPREPPRTPAPLSIMTTTPVPSVVKGAASAQVDSLVLQVKGLREALHVRCLHAKSTFEPAKVTTVWGPPSTEEAVAAMQAAQSARVTVRYVFRAEDVGTGREWLVFPRYSDFSELHQELLAMWPPIADLPFPTKRPVSRLLLGAPAVGGAVVDERIVGLEAFLHGALTLLGIYAPVDPRSAGSLRLIQDFLGTPEDLFAAEAALPSALRDQKRAELLLYKLLNQVDSPAARMKHMLMRDFKRDVSLATDVESLMKSASSRLLHLQEFLLEHHEEQLSSCLEGSPVHAASETKRARTRKAVRRQVELSLYLPLRRCLWKELASRLQGPARNFQRAIKALRRSPPSIFGVQSPDVFAAAEWGPAKEAMGQATRRVLPTDQIESLHRAAEHIAALHASLLQSSNGDVTPGGARNNLPHNGKPESNAVVSDEAVCKRVDDEEQQEAEEEEDIVFVEGSIARDGFSFREGRREDDRSERGENDALFEGLTSTEAAGGVVRELEGEDAGRPRRHTATSIVGNDAHGLLHGLTGSVLPEEGGEGRSTETDDTRVDEAPTPPAEGAPPARAPPADAPAMEPVAHVTSVTITASTGDASVALDESSQTGRMGRAADAGVEGATSDTGVTASHSGAKGLRRWSASSRELEISPHPEPSGRTSSWDSISDMDGGDRENAESDGRRQGREESAEVNTAAAATIATATAVVTAGVGGSSDDAMGADDFLPLFALALAHSAPFDLLVPQTLLTHLMDAEGSLSEAGYLVATLEAAVSFITQVYMASCCADGETS